ncbi:MAG: phosphoribosylformylglycinamidine synthase subunit PurS [Deltaproteobacteria bacterium]
MKARVYVTLKKGVLDPQGKAVLSALNSMDFNEVKDVRIGKFIELTIDDGPQAEKRLRQMCERLLANTVIEDFKVDTE